MSANPSQDIEFEVKKKILIKAKEQLRCTECLCPKNPIDAHFFKCESSNCARLFCLDCAEKLDGKCPSSKSTVGHESQYLKKTDDCFFEVLWSDFPSFCKYEKFGCQELFHSKDLKTHEEICPFNLKMMCPVVTCDRDLTGQDIKMHFQQSHWNCPFYQYSVFDSVRLNVPMARIYAYNQMFLFCCGATDKSFQGCLYLLGDCQDAKNYQYKLTVCGTTDKSYSHAGKVHPLSESFQEILENRKGLVINTMDLGRIVRNKQRPDITLDIELA